MIDFSNCMLHACSENRRLKGRKQMRVPYIFIIAGEAQRHVWLTLSRARCDPLRAPVDGLLGNI
jgi:hypothetical protein